MQNDYEKTKFGVPGKLPDLDTSIDRMLYGPESMEEHRINEAIKRKQFKVVNHHK